MATLADTLRLVKPPVARRLAGRSRLVTIQHATPRRNVRSIFCTGLQPGLARGKLKAVWLHASGKTRWAIQHVASRHRVPADKVVVLVLRVPRSMLRRNRRGLWYCPCPITPRHIVSAGGLRLFRPAADIAAGPNVG